MAELEACVSVSDLEWSLAATYLLRQEITVLLRMLYAWEQSCSAWLDFTPVHSQTNASNSSVK